MTEYPYLNLWLEKLDNADAGLIAVFLVALLCLALTMLYRFGVPEWLPRFRVIGLLVFWGVSAILVIATL